VSRSNLTMLARKGGRANTAKVNKQMDSFTFVDLFSGIGGMRLGFESAGGECLFSCERDKWARKTYEVNFGDVPHEDIRTLEADDLPDHDVMVAGFPCQPFSIAGVSKKNALNKAHGFRDDDQGTLFFVLEELIKRKQPKVVVLENVRGLATHNRGRTLKWLERRLRHANYGVSHCLVQGSRYVPQNRQRLFIVALLDGTEFEFPAFEGVSPRPVLRDILDPEPDPSFTITDKLWAYLPAYAEKHRLKGNGFGYGLASPNGISRTLSARYHKDGAEILIPQEGKNPRRLTPDECRKLMGFPDGFQIIVSNTQAYRQFGNSVVVPAVAELAQAVAQYLSVERGDAPEREVDARPDAEVGPGELPRLRVAADPRPLPGFDGRDDGPPDPSGTGRESLAGIH
jgi:DNA (cytosine-5)-methyltransferase 1